MSGIWVAGPSRSGTSMVAGLLAAHGVAFGRCVAGDEYNPKGYFEHVYLKSLRGVEPLPPNWPAPWWDRLRSEGWDGRAPWGVKGGAQLAPIVQPMRPTVVIICRRPIKQIVRSRSHVRWAKGSPRTVTRNVYRALASLTWPRLLVNVRTPEIAAGRYGDVLPAFDALDLAFDPAVADAWVEPGMWNRSR